MNIQKRRIRKKLLCFLLASLLLLCSLPGAAAQEGPGDMAESIQLSREADPLLVTGGHNTYMSGYAGSLFLPDRALTRAETAQMLYNLLAAKPPVSESKFSDVALTAWFGTAANALAEAGVLSGYKDGTFAPNSTITRAEFVTALCKCFSLEPGTASFEDVPETFWAYPHIAAATAMKWISGLGNGLFEPNRGIKRSEAVAVMNAALGRVDDGFAADREIPKFKDVPKSHWAYLQIAEAAAPAASPEEPDDPDEPDGEYKVGQTLQVTASGLNLREAPVDGRVITVLYQGAVITVTDISQLPWLGVKTSNGQTGFVSSEYVQPYTPGAASGAGLSNTSLSLHQYQTARLDASITSGSLSSMSWTSSNPDVALVGYTLNYGASRTQGAMVYGKNPGTATLTFSDASGNNKSSCTVTVTAPESVRFAYASENSPVKGRSFDLVAVTDPSQTSVKFQILNGPAGGTYTSHNYTNESRVSKYNLPTNTVHVFKHSVSFGAAGMYTLRASAGNGSQDFQVLVRDTEESVNVSAYGERRCSTEGLRVIANFEGSVPEIEDDIIANGNPTVGFGYVVPKGGAFYNNLTQTELFALLVDKVNNDGYTSGVNRFRENNNLKMTQAQFDALVSFVYNCGTGTLDASEYNMPKVMLNAVIPPEGISESQSYPGVLNIDSAVMYKDADLSSASLATVPGGSRVTVIGTLAVQSRRQLWYKVKYNNQTGWIPAGYVALDASGLIHDLAYADAASLSNNMLQWHRSAGSCWWGLLARRLAECKIFFFGNYEEAYHSHPNYGENNYGFNYPDCEKQHE